MKKVLGSLSGSFDCSIRLMLFNKVKDQWRPQVVALPLTDGKDLFGNCTARIVI